MCLSQEAKNQNTTTPNELLPNNVELQLPTSPWNKLIKQMSKSKLRNTTKINLNKYWSKFGEILTSPSKIKTPTKPSNQTPVKKRLDFIEFNNSKSKINDSTPVINNRYELLEADEINENLINEIKEIWSFKAAEKCQLCSGSN